MISTFTYEYSCGTGQILLRESRMAILRAGRKAVAHSTQVGQSECGGRSIRTVLRVLCSLPGTFQTTQCYAFGVNMTGERPSKSAIACPAGSGRRMLPEKRSNSLCFNNLQSSRASNWLTDSFDGSGRIEAVTKAACFGPSESIARKTAV